MKMAAVLLLVIAVFTVVPSSSSQQVAKDAKHHQKPTNPAPAEQQPRSSAQQGQAAENVQAADKQYAVAVKEMPPKETWDKVYVVLTGILVGVGILTFIAVGVQAIETKKAAAAAEKSAAAAKTTADVMVVSMLPQISISGQNITQILAVGDVPRVPLSIDNTGATDARECRWESWIEIIPANDSKTGPMRGFSEASDHFVSDEPFTVFAHSKIPIILNIPIRNHLLSPNELDDLKRLRTFLCVRLVIGYKTVFSPVESDEEEYLGAGFIVLANGFGFMSQYAEHGKRERQNPN